MMLSWVQWRQTASRCSWATPSTSWTAPATPTFASCTARDSSARIRPSWSRASTMRRKVDRFFFFFKRIQLKPPCVSFQKLYFLSVSPTEKKPNYLKALSNIVNKLPKQVQVTELPAVSTFSNQTTVTSGCLLLHLNLGKSSALMWGGFFFVFFVPVQLLSLLLEALSCPDQTVQLSTLSCLQPVLIDPPSALILQLEALVSRLLALTSSPAMVSDRINKKVYSCCIVRKLKEKTQRCHAAYQLDHTVSYSDEALHYRACTC